MLNTFDNAQRNESRRMERERSIRAMKEAYEHAGEADEEGAAAVETSTEAGTTTEPYTTYSDTPPDASSSRRGVPAAFLDESHEEDLISFANGPGMPGTVFGGAKRVEGGDGGGDDDEWDADDSVHSVPKSEMDEPRTPELSKPGVYRNGLYAASPKKQRRRGPGAKLLRGIRKATFGPRRDKREERAKLVDHRTTNLAVRGREDGYDISAGDVPLSHRGRGGGYGHGSGPGHRRSDRCFVWAKAAFDFVCRPCRLLVLLATAVSVPLLVKEVASNEFGREDKGPAAGLVHPHHQYPNHNLAKIEDVAKRIINSGASTRDELSVPADPDRMPRSPQNKAMEWIALADPAHLDPEDDFLLQRYGLAVFWFATHPEELLPDGARTQHHAIPTRGRGPEESIEPEWTKSDGWMTDSGICSWHGVRCRAIPDPHKVGMASTGGREDEANKEKELNVYNADGEVTALLLDTNNIAGTLPDEIFTTLTELEILDLNSNGMEGTLPESLGMLKRVTTLSLNGNDMRGTIPESVSKLTSIQDLDLGENMFSGTIPGDAIGLLGETLVELSLFGNDFTGTIPWILGELTAVESLYLDSNKLTGQVPEELERLQHLKDLRLRDNALTGQIPDGLGELRNLNVLYLDSNELTGPLPTRFGKLGKLEEMNLYDNNLSGPLPDEWSKLGSLKHMYLDGNGDLTGTLPPSWGTDLHSLQHLYLSNNQVHGPIPVELAFLSKLEKLHLRNNRFSGTVPHELGALGELRELMLEGNMLHGPIPMDWGLLRKLEELALQHNMFTGEVPKEICELKDPAGGSLQKLTIHCQGMEEPELTCNCCTEC